MSAPSAAVRLVLDALERAGCTPRASAGGWTARCPAHEDRIASLSVGAGREGRAVLKCHAGCETGDVLKGLGLEMSDLFEKHGSRTRETRYPIRNADGNLVATHVRQDGPDGKRFYWERDGKPGLGGIGVARLPLYGSERLRGWAAGEAALVVEGEKAADALRGRGFAVLATVSGAAVTPSLEVLEVLRGRDVILWPDADQAGRRHMHQIAAWLASIAGTVRWFEWPDAPETGDAHDYFAAGGTPEGLRRELAGAVTPPTQPVEADARRLARERSPSAPQGRALAFTDPDGWPDAVNGATLANELVEALGGYVVLPRHAAEAVALWALHSHALEAAQVSPLLMATSPTRRCGKTTLLHVLSALVPRPLMTSNVSPAALYRSIEKYRPTLLVDEADTFVRLSDELRGLLNAGHTRGAFVIRSVGKDFEPRKFTTWSAKAVALIGRLPDTIEDRAVIVPMRRRNRDERVRRLRLDRLADLEPLRRRAWRWAHDELEALRLADPEVPAELDDRQSDNWRPLLAIADLLGGDWPSRARQAAVALAGVMPETENAGELLLADLKKLFEERRAEEMPSEEVRAALHAMDGRPWPEWRDGKPITLRGIARLLKPFGIESRNLRVGDQVLKGYALTDLEDAFSRYLPLSVSATALPGAPAAVEVGIPEPLHHPLVADAEKAVPSSNDAPGSAVADPPPGSVQEEETTRLLAHYGWEPVPDHAPAGRETAPRDGTVPRADEERRQGVLPLADCSEPRACPTTSPTGFQPQHASPRECGTEGAP